MASTRLSTSASSLATRHVWHCGAAMNILGHQLWPCAPAIGQLNARGIALKARARGTPYVPRKVARRTLGKAHRNYPDPTLLLPPFLSAYELRIIFRLDYAGTLRMLGVRKEYGKYFWKDHDGRQFETSAKKRILVPFDIAAIPAQGLGYKPKMVDVEADWSADPVTGVTVNWTSASPIPVVAVLGHIDHGKTTLLDALCGASVVEEEPGRITQDVRAMTAHFVNTASEKDNGNQSLLELNKPSVDLESNSSAASQKIAKLDSSRMTFMDTPGHEAFEVQRGRTMAAADVAIVVVSVERGAELQTEEVLMHASRWGVPVVFALNKIDLPDTHLELTRAELRRQCQRLHERGDVEVDWTREAEEAVPISALKQINLRTLMERVQQVLKDAPAVPLNPEAPPTLTPGEGKACKNVLRRTDFLVGIDSAPSAVALIVEVQRGPQQGERILTLLVRNGKLLVGHYFVAGTVFGRITHLALADGGAVVPNLSRREARCESATTGMALQIMGIRQSHGGDCAPDDLLFVFPRERAYRLSEHRRRIETLSSIQTYGPPIEVVWERDPGSAHERVQAAFERHPRDNPEKHSQKAYYYSEKRKAQIAIEEVSRQDGEPSVFSTKSLEDFEAPFQTVTKMTQNEESDSSDSESPVGLLSDASSSTRGGRRSRLRTSKLIDEEASGQHSPPHSKASLDGRFKVISPSEDNSNQTPSAETVEPSGGGRRSARKSPKDSGTGAWTVRSRETHAPKDDFVYYTDRKSWTEEADIDTTRVGLRWQERDRARWEEQDRRARLVVKEKELAEKVRREVFGEALLGGLPDDTEEKIDDGTSSDEEYEDEVEPLPQGQRVVPLILKAKSLSQFEILQDKIEEVQEAYAMRIVIVHGGLGPVVPSDVMHAEVEKKYGYCPIYAFQVGVHPVAVGHADKEQIDIRRFDVFTELVADVAHRCERLDEKVEHEAYAKSIASGAVGQARF